MKFNREISIIVEYIEYSFDVRPPIFIISMIISKSRKNISNIQLVNLFMISSSHNVECNEY